jgi:hypothetical protein
MKVAIAVVIVVNVILLATNEIRSSVKYSYEEQESGVLRT